MTLLDTVKDITKQNPTEEEAMCYARDNFGILAAYLKEKHGTVLRTLIDKLCIQLDEKDKEIESLKGVIAGASKIIKETYR